ncbi:NRDE family protein [Marinomonas posidonica]|uniref:NRDE family protein n=1 Tax=Marinomonas posidonica TaxID=936476 RepID=UPI0037350075
MCSVSWCLNDHGYQIYFNRDEQKTRPVALPPKRLHFSGVEVLMPIDPVGRGSWISTNNAGLSLCLLNNYQGKMPATPLISRGLLLSRLAKHTCLNDVEQALRNIRLNKFAPFILLSFDLSLCEGQTSVRAFHWDGEAFSIGTMASPVFSSAVALGPVTEYRNATYQDTVGSEASHAARMAFHCHHHAEQGYKSICLHREDAQTVSFTHVSVTPTEQYMSYVAGSPCNHLTPSSLAQNRLTLSKQTTMSEAF